MDVHSEWRSSNYILHDGQPVPCADVLAWLRWMELHDAERCVALTRVLPDGTAEDVSFRSENEIQVSTIFLAHNCNYLGGGPPILWETLAFDHGAAVDETMRRYRSREAALNGHQQVVAWVREHVQRGKPLDEEGEEDDE